MDKAILHREDCEAKVGVCRCTVRSLVTHRSSRFRPLRLAYSHPSHSRSPHALTTPRCRSHPKDTACALPPYLPIFVSFVLVIRLE